MEEIDMEALALRAIQQARLLTHRAELASKAAVQQAVTLLLDRGMSHREIAKLTGLSKSDVSRKASQRPPLGVLVQKGTDDRVYKFADEWIWGDIESANRVIDELLQHGAGTTPTEVTMANPHYGETVTAWAIELNRLNQLNHLVSEDPDRRFTTVVSYLLLDEVRYPGEIPERPQWLLANHGLRIADGLRTADGDISPDAISKALTIARDWERIAAVDAESAAAFHWMIQLLTTPRYSPIEAQ